MTKYTQCRNTYNDLVSKYEALPYKDSKIEVKLKSIEDSLDHVPITDDMMKNTMNNLKIIEKELKQLEVSNGV